MLTQYPIIFVEPIMIKKIINLEEIQVESFVTSLHGQKHVKGGVWWEIGSKVACFLPDPPTWAGTNLSDQHCPPDDQS